MIEEAEPLRLLLLEQLHLAIKPGFELEDGFALLRQLDLCVTVVHIARPLRSMADDFPADFLKHSGKHHPRIRGMAQIVESEVPNPRPAQACSPGGLDVLERSIFEGEDPATILTNRKKHVVEARRERNLTHLPFRRLRVGDVEDAIVEVDVLKELMKNLSPAHSGIESAEDDPLQVQRCGGEEFDLFGDRHYRALGSAFPLHAQPAQWIREQVAFLDTPVENAAQDTQIAVNGGGGNGLHFRFPFLDDHDRSLPFLAVFADSGFVDVCEWCFSEEWDEMFHTVERMRPPHAVRDEVRSELSESHLRIQFRQPVTRFVQVVMELPFDGFGLAAIGCSGCLVVPDAIDPDISPPLVATFEERHGLSTSFLLFGLLLKNPSHDLMAIEDEFAHGPRTQARKPLRDIPLPDRPG